MVGSWSTDCAENFDATVYRSYEDGVYTRESGTDRASGRYSVKGAPLMTDPGDGEPKTEEWTIGGDGCLDLNGVKHCPSCRPTRPSSRRTPAAPAVRAPYGGNARPRPARSA